MKAREFIIEEKQQLNEFAWIVPAVATAARVGASALGKLLTSQGAKQAAKLAGKGTANITKTIAKNPKTALAGYGLYEIFDTVDDVLEFLKNFGLAKDVIMPLAQVILKYSIPVVAIYAIIKGGPALIDYMKELKYGKEDELAIQQ